MCTRNFLACKDINFYYFDILSVLFVEESPLFIPELFGKFSFCPKTSVWSETNPELLEKSISHLIREKCLSRQHVAQKMVNQVE